MDISYFEELVTLGLKPIPIYWDANTKDARSHVVAHSKITDDNWDKTTLNQWVDEIRKANGIAIKLFPPFGTLDFDIKNTNNKKVFNDWFKIVEAERPEVLRKICIETTRNAGYHAYIKYAKLTNKVSIALSDTGAEVIAVYTGGLLSYCSPTPGYEMFHNSFEDLQELTQDEYDFLVSTAALFNEYQQPPQFNNDLNEINYPIEYESTCLQFDNNIPDEYFETLLNSIDLYEVNGFRYGKKQFFTAYLRKGSLAKYSAKVYFKSKRLLLFTTSIPGFPTWADNKGAGDKSWVLTPSKILYYSNKKDWAATIEQIEMIADSIGITVVQQPITEQPMIKDRMKFPYDIFPDFMQEYINCHSIQHEFIAGFMLGSLATAIGNTCYLEAIEGWNLKGILYLAIVGHAGGAKSPAMRIAFEFLKKMDSDTFHQHKLKLNAYNEAIASTKKGEKEKPVKPILQQVIINDATIETVINVLQYNPNGCAVLADELIGFLNRMNAYKQGDDMQKWLEMWDGGSVMLQRISRDESKIEDYTCNVIGGIQPGVLEQLSKGDNQFNGFYHRFLFVYPEAQPKPEFKQLFNKGILREQVQQLFDELMMHRSNPEKRKYVLGGAAMAMYKKWHDHKNEYYNNTTNDNAKGIIAKYQAYCLRFALIIQAVHDAGNRGCEISGSNMERAIRLTEYFFGNMNKALKLLAPETPVDTLKKPYTKLYEELPELFTMKAGIVVAGKHKVKDGAFKMFVRRNKELFREKERGIYEKVL